SNCGACKVCGTTGSCGPVTDGTGCTVPKVNCQHEGASYRVYAPGKCTSGSCTQAAAIECGVYSGVAGSGSCKTSGTGTVDCADGYGCDVGSKVCKGAAAKGAYCDGAIVCTAGLTCVEYTCCDKAACGPGETCKNPLGTCKNVNGQVCSKPDDCASGFCVD